MREGAYWGVRGRIKHTNLMRGGSLNVAAPPPATQKCMHHAMILNHRAPAIKHN